MLGLKKGYEVFVSDNGTIKDRYRPLLQRFNIEFEEGGHTMEKLFAADIIIKSPGIPEKAGRTQGLQILNLPQILWELAR